eukprot:CAMPEP_0118939848 /NCGR_PEP_ID=MMETSP1169-20130426/29991_1 /TAXON_ID=36882 /ORGANISM="Pyramimonas obovata, Strain CCMP722" /LENGTH=263 /DNA_ID=CAMNT_0006884201 /DNA_START=77 /DNA_END=865 /DNA_ORIENTATION=-
MNGAASLRLALGLLVCLLPSCSAVYCPSGWTQKRYSDGTEKCYKISDEAVPFTMCQEAVCGPQASTLVCIANGEENEYLLELLLQETHTHREKWGAWIGFHEGLGEGHWSWTSTCSSTFTNWYEGEPNNYCGDEDCALVSASMWGEKWVDAACSTQAPCICEYGANLSEEYTQDVIEALQANKIDYDDCKRDQVHEDDDDEGEKLFAENMRILVAIAILLLGILVVLIIHLVVITCALRRSGVFSRGFMQPQELGFTPLTEIS